MSSALTRGIRAEAVELASAVVRRTFALRQFARLLGQIEPGVLPDAWSDRPRPAVPLAGRAAADGRRFGGCRRRR